MTNQNTYYAPLPPAEMILNGLTDSILVIDKQSKIQYANSAAQALFEKDLHELTGSCFDHPLSVSVPYQLTIKNNNKLRTVHVLTSLVQWDDQEAYLVSLRDITQLAATIRKLKEKNRKLETANRELMQHASLTSHDLKEPVRKIKIYADRALQKDGELDQQTREQIIRISQSADRLRSLITAINELSSTINQSGDCRRLDLNTTIKDVLQDLDLAISEKNVEIEVDVLPTVNAVASQMHRLFLNLILNAIKYSKPYITPKISIQSEERKKFVSISVKDNGIGLSDQFGEKIFQPFIRLHKKNVEGSGIGLTICKKIVEAHGGTISVNSKEGEGSCFVFTLRKR
jgi:light-regulated signal transduction histidine kinase (bacteriophytochrome)